MEPSQPDPPEATTLPVRRGPVPPPPVPPKPVVPELPPESQTVALRPGGIKQLLSGQKPAEPPTPEAAEMNDATVGYRKVAQAREALPPSLVAPPDSNLGQGGTVSINQVKRMRELLEAPPPSTENPPGTTTIPFKRPTGPRLIPQPPVPKPPVVLEPPAPEPPAVPEALPEPPAVKPKSTIPGNIQKPRPSSPASGKPPAPPEPIGDIDPKLLCPHCKVKLVSPESLGMCPSCGYCRSLEEGKGKIPAPKVKKGLSLFGLVEFCQMITWVPLWFWVLLGGVAAIVLGTIYGPRYLTSSAPQRAWWGTTEFVVGLVLLIGAQVWALVRVAAEDEGIGPMDFLLPTRIWRLVVERLPQTRGLVWAACWGWTLTLSALAFSGMPFTGLTETEDGILARELRKALTSMKQEDYRSMQAAAQEDVKATAGKPAPEEPKGDDHRPSKRCAVIGYTKDSDGKPNGVIVATAEKGRLQYAGIVRTGLKRSREFLERLGALEKVDGPTEGGAVWVKPDLTVDVHHSGTGEKGTLNNPNLGGVAQPGAGE